jgi:2,4-dienoyl-CoA reductase-like NADH-dependent reductase (Old Yellow Enzyme family)
MIKGGNQGTDLFQPFTIGALSLKNRFVRSATAESAAGPEGVLTEGVFSIYEALARGGVGLIVTGHMYVDEEGRCSARQTGIAGDRHLPGLRRLARAAQDHGAKVVAQINHAARCPEEMSPARIRGVVDRFVAAAARAQEAGFDGVQIHAAHGFLLSGFLTPAVNLRTDAYGGNPAGQRRLLLEIASGLRRSLGPQYPVLCKLGVVDGCDDCLALEESAGTAQALQEAGIDALEVSCTRSGDHVQAVALGIDTPQKEAYFSRQARVIKQSVAVPILLVGGLRSRQVMQGVVEEGVCDMVSLSRPFIREPDLVNRLAAGETERSSCLSCGQCFSPHGLRCAHASAPTRRGWWEALKSAARRDRSRA